jgi:uncharacterized protein YndB with AHSA1/START domain
MTSVAHSTFVLDRTYPVSPERVFAAWASVEAKSQWFGDPDAWEEPDAHTLDFRVGGSEHLRGSAPGGPVFRYDATFCDIVENERIVASYDMHMNEQRISVSLSTMELTPVPGGTRLVLTEQGAFLDGLDTNEQREQGTNEILDKLGAVLAAGANAG